MEIKSKKRQNGKNKRHKKQPQYNKLASLFTICIMVEKAVEQCSVEAAQCNYG